MSDLAAQVRFARRHWAAPGSSHDRIIYWLRVLLPIMIGVLTAFLVTAPVLLGGDVSFVLDKNKVEVARERMRVQSAVYRGQDAKGQAFSLSAGSAIQKSASEPIVQINQLGALIQLSDGPATLRAPHGEYDLDHQQVTIDSPLEVRATDGYQLNTSAATVDLKTRRLTSTGPVTGMLPQGPFSADRMTADLETRIVHLDGNTRLRIKPGKRK